jgi:hypothetical protein
MSYAQALANDINANTVLQAGEIGGQYVAGTTLCAISHRFDDVITVGAAAYDLNNQQVQQDNGGVFVMIQGQQILDAGPVLGLNKFPEGWTPTAGSNVGQIQYGGPTVELPGQVAVQYATICGNVLDPHSATIRGEFEIDTAENVNGQTSIQKRVGVSKGMYLSDANGNSAPDMGKGTISLPAGGGIYINGVKVL